MSKSISNAGNKNDKRNYKSSAKGIVKSNSRTTSSVVNLSQRYLEFNSSNRVIFSSGSAVEFSLARSKIINEFKKEGCYSLIEVPPEILIPNAAGVFLPIPAETVFDELEPVLDEADFILNRTNTATERRNNDIGHVNLLNAQQLNNADRQKVVLDIERKFNEDVGKIQHDLVTAQHSTRSQHNSWLDRREKHELKVSKIFRVFDRCFGSGPKSVIQRDLNDNRFRTSWVILNRHYYIGHGGRTNAMQLNSLLLNLRYEKVGVYENLDEHVNLLHHLAAEYQVASGNPIPEIQLLKYLEDSLLKCDEAKKDFRLIFDHMKINLNVTLPDFIGLLHREVSQIITREQTTELVSNQTTLVAKNDDESSSYLVTTGNTAGSKWCEHCETNTHNTNDCWKMKHCIICEATGHPTERCKHFRKVLKLGKAKLNYNNKTASTTYKPNNNSSNSKSNSSSSNNVTFNEDKNTKTDQSSNDYVKVLPKFLKNTSSCYLLTMLITLFKFMLEITSYSLRLMIVYLMDALNNKNNKCDNHCNYNFLSIDVITTQCRMCIYNYSSMKEVDNINIPYCDFQNDCHNEVDIERLYSDNNIMIETDNIDYDSLSNMIIKNEHSEYNTLLDSHYHYDCFVTGHHITLTNDIFNETNYPTTLILNDRLSMSLQSVYNNSNEFVFSTTNNNSSLMHNIPFYFIFDTGATCNMIPRANELMNNFSKVNGYVTLGSNEYRLPIVGRGTLNILHDVIYVPGLKFGLISISYFDRLGYDIRIRNNQIHIIDEKNKLLVLSGYLHDCNLYFLDHMYYSRILNMNDSNITTSNNEIMNTVDVTNDESIDTLHKRWGHIGSKKLKAAYKNQSVLGLKRSYEDMRSDIMHTCPACLKGSMRASNIPVSNTDNKLKWEPLEKIAIDYKGDFPIRSVHGYYGFFLLCDYNSGYLYPHMVNSKRKMIEALNVFKNGVVTFYKGDWKILQSDYDSMINSELVKNWLSKNKIKLQLSAPYLHYQNGFIERQIQNVMDKARTLMIDNNVPPKYWEYAIVTACYYLNRTPNRDNIKTPYEIITKEKPSISHFVPFFCPGYYHVSVEERHKLRNRSWTSKAQPCRMLGYDERCKDSYIVLNTVTRRILTRSNCVFDINLSLDELNEIFDQEFEEFIDKQSNEHMNDDINQLDEIDNRIIKDIDVSSKINNEIDDEEEGDDNNNKIVVPLSRANVQQIPISIGEKGKLSKQLDSDDEGSTTLPSEDTDEDANNIVLLLVSHEENAKSSQGSNDDEWNEFLQWYEDACHIVNHLSLPPTPRTTDEALSGPDSAEWEIAIIKELEQMDDKKMFKKAPQEGRAMKTKLVYRVTFNNDYTIKYKVRLVACGYSQIFGLDYDMTYSPTVSSIVVLLLLNLIAVNQYVFGSFDVKGAFLEGEPDKKLYCRLPTELSDDGNKKGERVEILRNFYGEKQAPKVWNDYFDKILVEMGFQRCPADPCLYFWCDSKDNVIICIHVDDGLITSNNPDLIDKFFKNLRKFVEVNHFYPANKFIGVDMIYKQMDHKMILSQTIYIDEKIKKLINDLGISSAAIKSAVIPMSPSTNLRTAIPNENNDSLLNITGSLRYLADRIRKDIATSTGEVSCGGASNPSNEHVKVAKQILAYIINTKDHYLNLGGNEPIELFGFCDAAYTTDGDSRSRLGGCLFLGKDSGAFHSFSKLATTVCHSSTEAEIKALDELARTIVWIRDILEFLNCPMTTPTKIYMDNKSAIQLCQILKMNHKVRHINIRINYIRELINMKIIELHFISTEYNVADILTKPLQAEIFNRHSNILLHGFKENNSQHILIHRSHLVINHMNIIDSSSTIPLSN